MQNVKTTKHAKYIGLIPQGNKNKSTTLRKTSHHRNSIKEPT